MPRALWTSAVALAAFLGAAVALASLERAGPRHADLTLDGGVPATLWLPGASPAGEVPPAVVLFHGFAGDRRAVSSLARRLASAGYAVLSIDLDGHGQNRKPYHRSRAHPDSFHATVTAAVEFLRSSARVDGSRIALAGHSMGAGASLDYGTRDSGIDALLLISGGRFVDGPHTPPNVLFVYAEGDPARIRTRIEKLAARVAGVERVERGRTYGDVALGSGVRLAQVDGANHVSIAWTADVAREMVAWLDAVFGIARSETEPAGDPRIVPVAVMALCLPFLVPGLGWVVGRLTPDAPELPGAGRGRGLVALAVALLLPMPLVALGAAPGIVPLVAADAALSLFLLAGVGLLVVCSLRGDLTGPALSPRPAVAVLGAAVATLGLYALLAPLDVFFHRIALTPERCLAFAAGTLSLLPLTLAIQLLLRRGPTRSAVAWAAAGRVVVVASLVVGLQLGLLDRALAFILGPLVLVLVLGELLAASIYASSRNRLAIALADAALLALVLSATMPIRI